MINNKNNKLNPQKWSQTKQTSRYFHIMWWKKNLIKRFWDCFDVRKVMIFCFNTRSEHNHDFNLIQAPALVFRVAGCRSHPNVLNYFSVKWFEDTEQVFWFSFIEATVSSQLHCSHSHLLHGYTRVCECVCVSSTLWLWHHGMIHLSSAIS